MQIVPQSASLSCSFFPSRPLLSAPPPPKLLCAPKIGGLLPARVSMPKIEIIMPKPLSRAELLEQLGPIRSREEMNAELSAFMLEAFGFLKDRSVPSARCLVQERVP